MAEIDILAIRDGLNELPFQAGKRRLFLGRVSDKVVVTHTEDDEEAESEEASEGPPADPPEVTAYLEQLEEQLGQYDLSIVRGVDDLDELYAIQHLRKDSEVDYTWMAEAMNWVSRVTTVALEMAVPAIIGTWFDKRLGSNHWGLVGLVIGVPLGMWHLLQWTKQKK